MMKKRMYFIFLFWFIPLIVTFFACEKENPVENPPIHYPEVNRHDKLPTDITKRTPETDFYPPILHSAEFENPIPLPGTINTSGAEDSPFVTLDGNTIYFFFTPDVRIPVEQQLFDQVSGVWIAKKINSEWEEAERVWLQDPGKLSLDGAVAVQGKEMWFASVREGFTGVNMFTAEYKNNQWMKWTYVGDRLMKEIQIGEVHLYKDSLYFHSARAGGKGSFDLWLTVRNDDFWSDPVNIDAVNSTDTDGWPFVTSNGSQLWFTRTHQGTPAIFRSLKNGNSWGDPELILSQFAGEPTLDEVGNLYFVHHFYENGIMIEADIYVSYRKI